MDSSTSHSNSRVPWIAVQLICMALAAWFLGALYTLRVNPEIAFYRHGHAIKMKWAQKLESNYTNKIVVFGGSSCTTSIDGARMVELHRLPVVNLGLHGGMGARILTLYGLAHVRSGDTLIVALEPDLLTQPIVSEPLGAQFAI